MQGVHGRLSRSRGRLWRRASRWRGLRKGGGDDWKGPQNRILEGPQNRILEGPQNKILEGPRNKILEGAVTHKILEAAQAPDPHRGASPWPPFLTSAAFNFIKGKSGCDGSLRKPQRRACPKDRIPVFVGGSPEDPQWIPIHIRADPPSIPLENPHGESAQKTGSLFSLADP